MSQSKKQVGPPVVPLPDHDPGTDYYTRTDREGKTFYYSVARLWDLAKDLPEFDMPLAGINIDWDIWHQDSALRLANHVRRVNEADLKKPILFDWKGRLADGRHRVIKALMEGRTTIRAKRLLVNPGNDGTHEEPKK